VSIVFIILLGLSVKNVIIKIPCSWPDVEPLSVVQFKTYYIHRYLCTQLRFFPAK